MAAITVPVFRYNTVLTAPPGGVSIEAASVIAGYSPDNELTVTATGLNRGAYGPGYVFLQARQSDDIEHGYPDEFALQVIQVSSDSVTFRVKRLDVSDGWGQQLQVDILFVPFNLIP